MKQIKYLLLFVAIFMVNSILAQNANQAKACMDRATANISNLGGSTARFALSRPGAVGRAAGTISVKGVRFVTTTPQTTVWFNGITQWLYMKSTDEVNAFTPTEAQRLSMNPYTLMTLYRQGYNLSMTDEGGPYVVHVKATNPKHDIPETYVTISKAYQLQKIKIKQANKWTTTTVSGIQRKSLLDNIFTFNKKNYPSAEVIDLR